MLHRVSAGITLQMPLRHVGLLTRVRKDMIPRPILWRSTQRDLLVPLLAPFKNRIDIDHHTPIIELQVVYDIADREFAMCGAHRQFSPKYCLVVLFDTIQSLTVRFFREPP
jgi:hypothetical protein